MKQMKKVDVIIDLQFGSTGKGALAGYLAANSNYDVVVSANMPNAGHTFIDAKGQRMVHKVLPSGISSPDLQWVLIGPGAVLNFERLAFEIDQARRFGYKFKVGIHENAVVLSDHHKELEGGNNYHSIGSTQQGSAEAMMAKIRRDAANSPLVRDILGLDCSVVVSHSKYLDILHRANHILAEGAQGYSLGINAGFWPYCTSRDCTPARFCADMLIPMSWVKDIYGSARTYPIRVGGTSGPGYRDQEEITWDKLGVTPERTTVTNRERRVFTFSRRQIWEAMFVCQPTSVFLNFCNYMETKTHELGKIIDTIDWFGRELGCGGVEYLGWGPTVNDIKKIDERIRSVDTCEGFTNGCAETEAAAGTTLDNSSAAEGSIGS